MQGDAQNQSNNQEITVEEILKQCMDSEGYVIMVGVITKRTDEKGFNILDWKYRRFHFQHEDVKLAIQKFVQFQKDDEADG